VTARLSLVAEREGSYFSSPKANQEFINSGCTLLDCVLGGGWPLGRISNVVGAQATGKTLIAIEACRNFAQLYPKGEIHYREAEAAFDHQYAAALGMPMERVNFGTEDFFTVEDLFFDLNETLTLLAKKEIPALYIVDSLDALSDKDELERDIDKGTYGAQKAKKMSEIFRRFVKRVEESNLHLMIISQVRDNMNAGAFAKKTSRSGGRALDFYASQIIELSLMETLTATISGVKRATGINIKAKCTKNKVALPLREAYFDIVFGLGIDRLNACVDWLKDIKRLDVMGTDEKGLKSYISQIDSMSHDDYWSTVQDIEERVTDLWYQIEESFLPKRKKGSIHT
jgi:recombination protein RecA